MARVLIVEDDTAIVENLTVFLKKEGFDSTAVSGQTQALELVEKETFDMMLLDISLTDGNGFAVCAAVKEKTRIPVIFLTASGDEYSVVMGLDLGADDYISKPFRPRELISRMKRLLRKNESADAVLSFGGLTVDLVKGIVTKVQQDGTNEELFLSALEYRLLLVFVNNRGITLSRNKLLEEIWDIAGEYVNDNTLTVYIKRLRDKIEDNPQNPTIIKTVRGLGYRLEK